MLYTDEKYAPWLDQGISIPVTTNEDDWDHPVIIGESLKDYTDLADSFETQVKTSDRLYNQIKKLRTKIKYLDEDLEYYRDNFHDSEEYVSKLKSNNNFKDFMIFIFLLWNLLQ